MVSGNARYAFHSDVKTLFFKKWGKIITNDGLKIMEYSCNLFKKKKSLKLRKFLLINLSNSLFFHDYINVIEENLDIQIVQEYSLPTLDRKLPHIRIEDRVSWDICRLEIPIIYFTDNFMALKSNYYWFKNRANNNDIIADRNGNIMFVDDFIN